MEIKIKWDKRGLDKALKDATKEAVRKSVNETQRMFDSLSRSQKGKPVEDVKRVLRQQWRSTLGGDITDPELTEYATALSEGGKVQVQAG